ncbi:hypothetical protein P153DRAFT_378153 [Dothidotthia symphoricarpi CBS 119687]|uniref:CENP-V/GFA domain-containing protein n=1 Tax=Dothidotthia symphoricarpi CBS 119687 TaxID=1392245 RepID=A0A6A6A6R8_9PLEO|nr:uncharacterized protein P153DRAFT_378153 [Dothidotthia symphoricarpi CBS 119687]KAF2126597.1 hypothetical protein P153DRAFT_378153 [Dothidotthia symphoricarpi CBS 119687]
MVDGRCNCGGIKVSIAQLPEQSAICYCFNCRRTGSGVGSIVYILDKKDITVNDPNNLIKNYKDSDTKSGSTITRQFCGDCGCAIMSVLAGDSGKVALKGGLFEKIPMPGFKSFEEEEPAWLKYVKVDEGNL